ncbi:MAG: lipopolysaccharide transport periplasmic protein LptA [bacterium]|nr:lipopolysaccharide transport periplasmic protein LptA [bacterium]
MTVFKIFALAALLLCVFHGPSLIEAEETKTNVASTLGADKFDSSQPLYINSNSLELDAEGRVFTYRGDVKISQGEMLITAEKVTGTYDDKNQMDEVVCEKNVVISKGDNLRAAAQRGVYKVKDSVVTLTEGPEVYNKGNILTADVIRVFLNEDRSEAEGNVRVKVVQTEGQSIGMEDIKKKGLEGGK